MIPFKKTTYLSLVGCSLSLAALSVHAATNWTGAVDADIGDSGNWDNGLPSNSSDPVNDGYIGLVGGSPVTVELEGRLDMNNKNYTVSDGSTIYVTDDYPDNPNEGFRWGNSTLTLDAGNLAVDTAETSYFGRGGDVTLNVNAGSTVSFVSSVYMGYDGQAIVNQTGGSVVIGGTLLLQYPYNADISGNVYNLTAGTVSLGGLSVNDENNDASNYFNFTDGSTGTLTITQSAFDFAAFIADGDIRINDNASSLLSDFIIDTSVSGQTTLSLIPEPGAYALLAGSCALGAMMMRRRR
jgi:hypothetical protein